MKNVYILFLLLLLGPGSLFCQTPKKSMKILIMVSCFPKINSVSVMNQITGLIDRGHDVHIFSFLPGNIVNVQSDVMKYGLINKTMYTLPSSLDAYDIIIFSMGHKLFDVRKSHNFKGKIVVFLRGYDITTHLAQNPHIYDHYFEICDLFMPVCNAFKKILRQEGCNPNKIIVYHSSIDCSKFIFQKKILPKNGIINIISAGRFVEKKGLEYSIQAVATLVKKYPNIRYTILGGGTLRKKYRQLVEDLNVKDKIKIGHWLTLEDYITILNQSHFFILPSITTEEHNQEGIANVLKEAMSAGLLAIATEHSGNAELIEHKVSGFLVPERSSDAIVEAIEFFINNPDKWASIQLAAKNKIHADFNKEKENDKLEAILYALLEKK